MDRPVAHTLFLSGFFQSRYMSLLLKRLSRASALNRVRFILPCALRTLCICVIWMFPAPVDGKLYKLGSSASPVVSSVLAVDAEWTTGGCLGLE